MLRLKLALARAAGALARRTGHGGTVLPGRVLLGLQRDALSRLTAELPQGTALVSATNGKTTSAAMAAAVLEGAGTRVVHNRTGANMERGVASALIGALDPSGHVAADLGLFEVDELWLARVAEAVAPRALVLGNLFRDQLDRAGELDAVADRWAEVVARWSGRTTFVLNADDPLVADLGIGRPGVTFFGVDDERVALPGLQHASDSKHCRRCGAAYEYEVAYLAHLGRYRCPSCGSARPLPHVAAHDVRLHGVKGASFRLRSGEQSAEVHLPLPGLYNVYNALGAAALCLTLGVPLPAVAAALGSVHAAFGRAETLMVDGRPLSTLLVKNPAGANEVLRTLALETNGEGLDLLGILNDGVADGRDVSWIWDADVEEVAPRVRRLVCAGTRAAELALRFKYAGLDVERIVVEPSVPLALDRALAGGEPGRPLYALPTYTALLALRAELAARGAARPYWER